MENLQIPFLADETLHGGSYQTPFLETITHGQRDNSRLLQQTISEAVNTAYQIGTQDKLQIQYSFIEGPDIFSDYDSD